MGIRTGTARFSGAGPSTAQNARGSAFQQLRDRQVLFDDLISQQNPSPLRLDAMDGEGYLIDVMELPAGLKLRVYHVITENNIDPRRHANMCCIDKVGYNDYGYIHLKSPMRLGGTVWEMDADDSMSIVPAVTTLGFAIVREADGELATAGELNDVLVTFSKTQLEGMHYPFNYLIGGA